MNGSAPDDRHDRADRHLGGGDDLRPQERPGRAIFSATLTPHRSLGPRGFATMMGLVAAVAVFASWRVVVLGAWPVAFFMVLDVALLYLAFRLSFRSGRAFEEVHVWPHRLVVRQVSASGREMEHLFNPRWARLQVTRLDDEGVVRLTLCGEGRAVQLGAFLNPVDRGSFAEAFGRALADVRSGRPTPSPAE